VQANKAGLLEIADIFVVNKADKEGARDTQRDIEQMLHLGVATDWTPPVLMTQADDGTGVEELWDAIESHRAHLEATGGLRARRLRRIAREISEIALANLRQKMGEPGDGETLDALAAQVLEGKLDPYAAADRLGADGR
jgi:LAO/AO transport system kinase